MNRAVRVINVYVSLFHSPPIFCEYKFEIISSNIGTYMLKVDAISRELH